MKEHKNQQLMDASCRVALTALLHDLGKFAERAGFPVSKEQLDAHKTVYCPWNKLGTTGHGYHSHVHAAYTALAFDVIEEHVPDLIQGDVYPFMNRAQLQADKPSKEIDSIINVAALHHKPATILQWIIATADMVASGFERDQFEEYNRAKEENSVTETGRNHYQARMLSFFEEASLHQKQSAKSRTDLNYRYPLKAFFSENIFSKNKIYCVHS